MLFTVLVTFSLAVSGVQLKQVRVGRYLGPERCHTVMEKVLLPILLKDADQLADQQIKVDMACKPLWEHEA